MAGAGPEGTGRGARPGLPAGGAGRDGGGGVPSWFPLVVASWEVPWIL